MYKIQWVNMKAFEGHLERTFIAASAEEAWTLYHLLESHDLIDTDEYKEFKIVGLRLNQTWDFKRGVRGICSIG